MSEKIYHKELAAGGWKKLSLIEQMGNIGSEMQVAALRSEFGIGPAMRAFLPQG